MKVMSCFGVFFCLLTNFFNLFAVEVAKKEVEYVMTPTKVIGAAPVVTPGNASGTTVVSGAAPTSPLVTRAPLAVASSNIVPQTATLNTPIVVTTPSTVPPVSTTNIVVPPTTNLVDNPSAVNQPTSQTQTSTSAQKEAAQSQSKAQTSSTNITAQIPNSASATVKITSDSEKVKNDEEKKEKENLQKEKEELDKNKETLDKEKTDLEKAKSDTAAQDQEKNNDKEKIEKDKFDKKIKSEKDKKKRDEDQKLISTLNTMSIEDEGNWLLKRVWWEQAEATFEKIIDVNDQVIQVQADFFNKSKEIDKQLANSFRTLGYEQGELNEIINFLLDETNNDSRFKNSESINQLSELLQEKKNELEKLKKDLEVLEGQNALIEDSLSELVNQVNKSREYERQAWADFKEIGRILNDKQAKVLFYQIDANLKNVQNILNYIKTDLNNFFNNVVNKANVIAGSISSQIQVLSKQGLDLKEQFNEYKNAEKQQTEQIEAKPRKVISKGWFETVLGWLSAPYNWIISFFK